MPNKQSRTQPRSKSSQNGRDFSVAAPVAWAQGGNVTETKAFYAQGGNFQLYHNIPAAYFNLSNLCDSIVTGATYNTRVGSKVHLRELEMNLVLNNKTDRLNVSYRVSVCAAPTTTSTDTALELFAFAGFTGLHIITNSELLLDTTFPHNQGSGMDNNVTPNKERSFTYRVKVPINRTVVFNTDGTCATRLIAFVTAYDAYATLQTDNIASVAQTSWRLVYTDA
jgi:hypothetical protein